MITDNQSTPDDSEEVDASRNDTAEYGDDTIGENTGDSALAEDAEKNEDFAKKSATEKSSPAIDVKTVVPDNDN